MRFSLWLKDMPPIERHASMCASPLYICRRGIQMLGHLSTLALWWQLHCTCPWWQMSIHTMRSRGVLQVQSSNRPEQQPAEEEQQEDDDSDEVGIRCWTTALRGERC